MAAATKATVRAATSNSSDEVVELRAENRRLRQELAAAHQLMAKGREEEQPLTREGAPAAVVAVAVRLPRAGGAQAMALAADGVVVAVWRTGRGSAGVGEGVGGAGVLLRASPKRRRESPKPFDRIDSLKSVACEE